MHVNLSAVELQHVDVLERVTSTLRRHRLDPKQLTLEITESVLVDAQMSATLRELHETGVRLALDDFGTGYSSLSYLRSFPLDVLKIAKPFVDGVTGRREERSFVRMIIELARDARARGRRRGHRGRRPARRAEGDGLRPRPGLLSLAPAVDLDHRGPGAARTPVQEPSRRSGNRTIDLARAAVRRANPP